MTKTLRVLAALLAYPDEDIVAAAEEFKEVLETEAIVPERIRRRVIRFIDELAAGDLYDLQERYVLLFDRTRSLSLHLFEHIHGQGRDRGQAMVDLQDLYASHGLRITARELPDFLPLFLEFLSTLPLDDARELLNQPLHVIAALSERLRKRKSAYACVFRALEAIAAGQPNSVELKGLLAQAEDDPDDLDALDRVWEEEPVTFGPETAPGACPAAGKAVARMNADLAAPGGADKA